MNHSSSNSPYKYRSPSSNGSSQGSRPRRATSHTASSRFSRPSEQATMSYPRSSSRSSQGGSSRPFSRGGGYSQPRRRGQSKTIIDISRFINKAQIVTETVEEFVPIHTFDDFKYDARIKSNLHAKGFIAPTPIQDTSIPLVLEGNDVVGIANTGTGKTAAFLLPLIDKVLRDRSQKVLILAPTRELALQIQKELVLFTDRMHIYSGIAIGGAPIGRQIMTLRRPHNFLIGTPGRVADLLDRRAINLGEYNNVVLDEADRMLDMGFIGPIRQLLSLTPQDRQTLFFSATMSPEIEKLIHEFLNDPVSVSVKSRETSADIHQDVIYIDEASKKIDVLHDLLIQKEFEKVLIFGQTKHGVETLSVNLTKRGFKAVSIHGDKPQSRRERALATFRDNEATILVATDVAARGLDIKDISHVINYDLPQTYDDYVHRIGRTGRAGKKGKALTFVPKG